jgi:hypothetical protein
MGILMQVLDITGTARRWNRLQVSAAVAVFLAFDNLAGTAFQGVQYVVTHKFEPFNPTKLIFPVLATAGALFVIRQFWTHGILFNARSIGKLRYVYWLLCAVGVGLIPIGLLAVQLAAEKDDAVAAAVAVATGYGGFILAGFSFWNLRMIKKLRREPVPGLGLTLADFSSHLGTTGRKLPAEAYAHIRLDRPAGLLWIAAGAVIFLFGAAMDVLIWEDISLGNPKDNSEGLQKVAKLIEIYGAFLVFKGRQYFVPKAEAILALDRRPPLLYLRSFLDEKPDIVNVQTGYVYVDRSLEMKLSRNFREVGPFVAIASPQDKLPKLGAARLTRTDDEWQGEVWRLMGEAQRIVALVGTSKWIRWEMGEIVARGYTAKTLFLVPVPRPWLWRRKNEKEQRIEALSETLGLPAGELTGKVAKRHSVLCTVMRNGEPLVLTSHVVHSNALFLAAMIGHYMLLLEEQGKAAGGHKTSDTVAAS